MTENKRVSRHSLKSDLSRVAAHVIQPEEYEELPELTDEMLARGTVQGRSATLPEPEETHLDPPNGRCHSAVAVYVSWLANSHG